MAFDFDFQERATLKDHVKKFFLYPDFWKDAGKQIPQPLRWSRYKFRTANLTRIPTSKGIYAFVLVPKYDNFCETRYLFYVGKTNRTFKRRFKEYLDEKAGKGKPRVKVFEMLNQYDGHMYFYFAPIVLDNVVGQSEDCVLDTFVPHVNCQIPEAKIKNELKYLYE